MTSRDFCFWLQGFLEIRGPGAMTAEQVEMVQRHLGLVFKHEIDPSMSESPKKTEHETKLDAAHAPPGTGTGIYPPGLIMRC